MPITKPAGFSIGSGEPVDDRIVKATIADRNAIPIARRFFGMVVRVISDPDASLNKEYFLPYPEEWLDGSGTTPLADYLGNDYWQVSASQIDVMQTTYDELATLIGTSSLIQGRKYLITDFATTHYFLDGDSAILTEINVAETEPIIVTAATSNSLAPIAISTVYPRDILHYDWNPLNWLNDRSFSDVDVEGYNAETISIITGFKGVITYREDTIQNNITHYDFRGVKFRRWAVDQPAWNSGTTYAKNDKVSDSGYIYVSLVAGNVDNAVSDTTKWVQILNYNNTPYWSWNSSEFNGITSDPDDYFDFYTFHYYSEFADNVIGLKTNFYDDPTVYTILPNIVFVEQGDDDTFSTYYNQHNKIEGGYYVGNSSIGSFFYSNSIGSNFYNNSIGSKFYRNSISGEFFNNSIGVQFGDNLISSYFSNNSIGSFFYSNSIGSVFVNNLISSYFCYNSIASNFGSNSIASGFKYNTVYPTAQSVNFTSSTHVYADYNCTIFRRADGTIKLSYVNNSDVTVIVLPTD